MDAATLSPDVDALEVTLPPGASTMRLAIPAFWHPDSTHWQRVRDAGSAVSIVVVPGYWPGSAKDDPVNFRPKAQNVLDSLSGTVLGYVHTRPSPEGDLRSEADILQDVKAWYDQFGQQRIDGIYFDQLVIPERPDDITKGLSRVAAFKAARPQAKAMILAGQCPDERVVGRDVDWALMWEDREVQYRQAFWARVEGSSQHIPSWWKDPAHRHKIAHTVHECLEPARQHALGLASERNAGNVFVMDQRGWNPKTNKNELYDHLPPYWSAEIREVNSYYDFGFDPLRALRAAHRYGKSQGKLHAWPNFEMAWRPTGHVRGTFLLDAGAHATERDVLREDLPGRPPLFDIPAVWRAAHTYARDKDFETALPTFELVQKPNGVAIRLILFAKNLPWLTAAQAPVGSTYQQPLFSEPGAVVRNVNRWAGSKGYKASFPTFVPDDPAEPGGWNNVYNCYALSNVAPVTWRDVLTSTYIDQLPR